MHPFVDLHVSVLAAHAPIEHFIEVYVTALRLDSHPQNIFLELTIIILLICEAQRVILSAQFPEETSKLVLLDLYATIPILGKLPPHLHESLEIVFELAQHVFLRQIVLLKLLDDDQNEKVEHNVRANDDQSREKQEGEGAATGHVFNTRIFFAPRAVKHYFVPVLAC